MTVSGPADGLPGFGEAVVHWQQVHGRHDLPWQGTTDPYRVWLSEIMLQQTQVATVRGYFERFVARLPDVRALAAASTDEVLGLWSGLGYYTRARNLHRCAQTVVAEHGGEFPGSAEALARLPGIGRSTAAAIASLCFGERAAILDANVKRVLSRVLAFDGDLSAQSAVGALWARAESLLPAPGATNTMGTYTQGMMDLGATVCTTRAPRCGQCPVAGFCAARRLQEPERFPVRARRTLRSSESIWLLWAVDAQGAVLLAQRPTPGIWAGLHCLPWFGSYGALRDAVPEAAREAVHDLPVVRHLLTHKELHLHPVRVVVDRAAPPRWPGRWVAAARWPGLGLPAPIRQLLDQACSQPKDVAG